jgi:threonine dehydrogenase-like Zn-dependent dehydrogenase
VQRFPHLNHCIADPECQIFNQRLVSGAYIDFVRTGVIDPTQILTETEPLSSAIDAYREFDLRHRGWTKVKLEPAA